MFETVVDKIICMCLYCGSCCGTFDRITQSSLAEEKLKCNKYGHFSMITGKSTKEEHRIGSRALEQLVNGLCGELVLSTKLYVSYIKQTFFCILIQSNKQTNKNHMFYYYFYYRKHDKSKVQTYE